MISDNRWNEARDLFAEAPQLMEKKPDAWLQTIIRCGLFDQYAAVPEDVKANLAPDYRQSVEDLITLYQADTTRPRRWQPCGLRLTTSATRCPCSSP